MRNFNDLQIAVARTGYVVLSVATFLAHTYMKAAVDVVPEKVEKINNCISPILDVFEKHFAETRVIFYRG